MQRSWGGKTVRVGNKRNLEKEEMATGCEGTPI